MCLLDRQLMYTRCNIKSGRKTKQCRSQARFSWKRIDCSNKHACILANACQYISRLVELCYPWNPGLSEAKRDHHGLHTPMSASSLEAAAHGCFLETFQLDKNCTDSLGSLALTCMNAAWTHQAAWLQHALVPRRALACATQPFIESLSHRLDQNQRYQNK